MPYICGNYMTYNGKAPVGSKHCVALVKECTRAPITALWKEGEKVRGNKNIKPGTAIATFVNGKYPNHGTGNHAAIYVRQDTRAIYVMDQWKSDKFLKIEIRALYFKGKNNNGYINPSNNGDAFSIIE